MDILDFPTRRELPQRVGAPVAILLHTTGTQDLDAVLRWYTAPDGLQPHYLIETIGTVRRIASEDLVAYHCAIRPAEARLYQRGYQEWSQWVWRGDAPAHRGEEQPNYREWRDTWRAKGLQSPLDLCTRDHPNTRSVGIELQQPTHPAEDIFTDAQYTALAELLKDVGGRNSIPLTRDHVLGHYDCSPMRRSTAIGSWDPGRAFGWNRLWDLVR